MMDKTICVVVVLPFEPATAITGRSNFERQFFSGVQQRFARVFHQNLRKAHRYKVRHDRRRCARIGSGLHELVAVPLSFNSQKNSPLGRTDLESKLTEENLIPGAPLIWMSEPSISANSPIVINASFIFIP